MARKRNALRSATRAKLQEIVRLEALGKTTEEIGAMTGMTPGNVADLVKHEEYRTLQDGYAEKMYGPIDSLIKVRKASVIMEDAAPDAADALVDLLNSEDEITQRLSATAILDRTGHGPIQRKAVKMRHELDPVSAKLLAQAMSEADRGAVVDVEVVDED